MRLRRFTKPEFLKQIGRPLLVEFFGKYFDELALAGIDLPGADLPDGDYYKELSQVAIGLDGLPDLLIEEMFAVEEMANDDGQQRLQLGVAEAQLEIDFGPSATHADVAMRVLLAAPELLARKHNEFRLNRLSSFEYFGSKVPEDRRETFTAPDDETLQRMTRDLNDWFASHNRGNETVHIEVYFMRGEFWFLVRHGDTFARTARVEGRSTSVLHYRPAKDDVLVYSPARDELRIHAGTKGEKEVYVETFGTRLFGDDRYFCERKAYTLDPLRNAGVDSLSAMGSEEIERVLLREIEVSWGGEFHRVFILKADDLFAAAAAANQAIAVPRSGRLVRAALDVYFKGVAKPRRVQIRPPNILKLGRHCDAAAIQRWLSDQGFRDVQGAGSSRGGITHVPPVVEP